MGLAVERSDTPSWTDDIAPHRIAPDRGHVAHHRLASWGHRRRVRSRPAPTLSRLRRPGALVSAVRGGNRRTAPSGQVADGGGCRGRGPAVGIDPRCGPAAVPPARPTPGLGAGEVHRSGPPGHPGRQGARPTRPSGASGSGPRARAGPPGRGGRPSCPAVARSRPESSIQCPAPGRGPRRGHGPPGRRRRRGHRRPAVRRGTVPVHRLARGRLGRSGRPRTGREPAAEGPLGGRVGATGGRGRPARR